MVMNFWEAQRRARLQTTLYLITFTIFTVIVAALSEFAMRSFSEGNYDPPIPYLGLAFLGITFAVAGYNYLCYKTQGGAYVAEFLGAEEVDRVTSDPIARMLVNVVEEVAVASSLPVPRIFILNTPEINAFAAGLKADDAAITVTVGALQLLNRTELQGVIAHEFGHIYNGDMKISLRLAALVMGFFIVFYLGIRLFQGAAYSRDSKKGGNPIALAAVILLVAGTITWFFGSILKAMVSRQREYLADACAVQFTRSSEGIANALRKIEKSTVRDMPKTGMAYSHLYFNDHSFWSDLFATHPPLEKRIEALEGEKRV
jgi:heat shock protein HtpX